MGCSTQKQEILNIPLQKRIYEIYEEINPDIFHTYFYKLNWKVKNTICYFQLINQEVLSKKEISDFFTLLKNTKIVEIKDIKYDLDLKNILYYVFLDKGVFITRNYKKIDFFLKNFIGQLIKIDFVHLSEEIMTQNEYFSFREIKRQSKYFFGLDKKEIDFSDRNKLVEEGKSNKLSDNEVDLKEEDFSEENNSELEKEFEDEYSDNSDDSQIDQILEGNNEENENILSYRKANSINKKDNKSDKKNQDDLLDELNNNFYKKIDLFLENKNKSRDRFNKNILVKEKSNEKKLYINKNINEIKENNEKPNDIKENSTIKSGLKILQNKINNYNSIDDIKKDEKTHILETKDEINDTNLNNNNINQNGEIIENRDKKTYKSNIPKKIVKSIFNKNPPFKIVNKNTLIINTDKLDEEINKHLETFFYSFNQTNNSLNEFEHIDFYNEDNEIKPQEDNDKNDTNLNKNSENRKNTIKNKNKKIPNDYILIYSNKKIPYDKRVSLNDIKKVFFINCNFTTKSIFYLKQLIGMLMRYKNLIKFGIYYNKIAKDFNGWKFFKSLFEENFNLRWVSFKNAFLGDKIFVLIAKGLMLKRIRYLNISRNNLSNSCMYFLNELLLKNQTLIDLDLSYNKHISFKGIQFILNGIKLHSNLTNLNLNHLNLNNCGTLIVELLKDNKNIKKLCLRKVNFDIKDLKEIINEIGKKECSLVYLDLSSNKTPKDEGLKEIAKLIYQNKSLKHLGLDNLNLNLKNYLPIFQSIFKNKSIESYSFDMNKGIPIKGFLNFFIKNPQVKKISITPWNIKREPNKKFSREQINLIQHFHSKAPQVIIANFDLRQRKSTKYYSIKVF